MRTDIKEERKIMQNPKVIKDNDIKNNILAYSYRGYFNTKKGSLFSQALYSQTSRAEYEK